MPQKKSLPVFIIGVAHRCGTNYLYSLLLKHQGFVKSGVNGEDFLLSQSNHLIEYVDCVASNWNPVWGNEPDALMRSLESGMLQYIIPPDANGRLALSKTPVPDEAINFCRVFTEGYMLILVRSGQDLAESYIRSFRHRFEFAVRTWMRGVAAIFKIVQYSDPRRVMVIRYEDLYSSPEQELRRIFTFMGLDPDQYDYQAAREADVIGSSDTRTKSGDLNWNPVKKSSDFNPLGRSESWSRWQHYRFNWLAGDYTRKLNYPTKYESRTPGYFLYNMYAAGYYYSHRLVFKIIHALRGLKYGVKGMVKAYKSDF